MNNSKLDRMKSSINKSKANRVEFGSIRCWSFRYEEEEDKRQDVESKRQYLLNRSKEKRVKDAEMMMKIKYVVFWFSLP